MTLAALLDLWDARDHRYALARHTLSPEMTAALIVWRTREIAALPDYAQLFARNRLQRTYPL